MQEFDKIKSKQNQQNLENNCDRCYGHEGGISNDQKQANKQQTKAEGDKSKHHNSSISHRGNANNCGVL